MSSVLHLDWSIRERHHSGPRELSLSHEPSANERVRSQPVLTLFHWREELYPDEIRDYQPSLCVWNKRTGFLQRDQHRQAHRLANPECA
jgi:hypothetical protein